MKNNLFKKILDNTSKGIFVYQDEKFQYANQKFLEIFGFDKSDIEECNFLDYVHPEYFYKINSIIRNILDNHDPALPASITYKGLRHDGRHLWLKLTPTIISYEGSPALLGNLEKTSPPESVKAKFNIQEGYPFSEDDFSAIFYVIDDKGRFLFISDKINELGWTPEKLIGKHFSNILHPEDVEEVTRNSVLPKYKDVITGDRMAPKLFDERRTGSRRTKGLEVRLVTNKNGQEEQPELRYFPTNVEASGLYNSQMSSYQRKHIGTAGIIKLD